MIPHLSVTPTPNSTGTITVDVVQGVATDLAGNVNEAANQATQAFNTVVISEIDLSAIGAELAALSSMANLLLITAAGQFLLPVM